MIYLKNTALHLASENNREHVVQYLLDSGAEFLFNNDKMSFFDIAIKNKHQEVLMAILTNQRFINCVMRYIPLTWYWLLINLRWEEALDLKSTEYKTPFMGIIQLSSEITRAVMDRCVTRTAAPAGDDCKSIVNYSF